jgi:small GTP-binding protein
MELGDNYKDAVYRAPENYGHVETSYDTKTDYSPLPAEGSTMYDQSAYFEPDKQDKSTRDIERVDEKEVLANEVMSVLHEKKALFEDIAAEIERRTKHPISSKRLMDIMRDGVLDDMFNKRDYWIIQEYTRLLRLPETTAEEIGLKASLMNDLFTNFLEIARRSAEIIISEISLPLKDKTFKAASLGGIAGGEKFVIRSVLLKISRDVSLSSPPGSKPFLYGHDFPSTEFAMKAAGQELIGASQYDQVFGQNGYRIIPAMQTIVDFKGYRIVALPLLPIEGERTLVYGSCDAGKHMICSSEEVALELERAAKILHLAKHKVKNIEVFTAGDVEVHKVVGDVYYMLDLTRSFPPEDRQVISLNNSGIENPFSSIYFRMMRPELLLEMKSLNSDEYPPISSDALSMWGAQESGDHNGRVQKATVFLITVQLDKLAKYLDSLTVFNQEIGGFFHRFGVNLRHLGLVGQMCKQPNSVETIVMEILVRSMKNEFRNVMRASCDSESSLRQAVVNRINMYLPTKFPDTTEGFQQYFEETGLKKSVSLRFGLKAFELICSDSNHRFIRLGSALVSGLENAGVLVYEEALTQIREENDNLRLHLSEIVGFKSSIKRMAVFEIMLAKSLATAANQAIFDGNELQSSRLRIRAVSTLQNCLKNHPRYSGLDSLIAIEKFLSLLHGVLQSPEVSEEDVQRLKEQALEFASFKHSRSDLLVAMEFLFRLKKHNHFQTVLTYLIKPCEQHIGLSIFLLQQITDKNTALQLFNNIQASILEFKKPDYMSFCEFFFLMIVISNMGYQFSPEKSWMSKAYDSARTECERFMLDLFSARCDEQKSEDSIRLVPRKDFDIIDSKSSAVSALCSKLISNFSEWNSELSPDSMKDSKLLFRDKLEFFKSLAQVLFGKQMNYFDLLSGKQFELQVVEVLEQIKDSSKDSEKSLVFGLISFLVSQPYIDFAEQGIKSIVELSFPGESKLNQNAILSCILKDKFSSNGSVILQNDEFLQGFSLWSSGLDHVTPLLHILLVPKCVSTLVRFDADVSNFCRQIIENCLIMHSKSPEVICDFLRASVPYLGLYCVEVMFIITNSDKFRSWLKDPSWYEKVMDSVRACLKNIERFQYVDQVSSFEFLVISMHLLDISLSYRFTREDFLTRAKNIAIKGRNAEASLLVASGLEVRIKNNLEEQMSIVRSLVFDVNFQENMKEAVSLLRYSDMSSFAKEFSMTKVLMPIFGSDATKAILSAGPLSVRDDEKVGADYSTKPPQFFLKMIPSVEELSKELGSREVLFVKCVIVGDHVCGKTVFVSMCVNPSSNENFISTALESNGVTIMLGKSMINVGLWDTAGGEDYDRLRPLSYPQTDVFILMYSVMNYNSFEHVSSKWIPEIQHHAVGVPFILVGTEVDLRDNPGSRTDLFEDMNKYSSKRVSTAEGRELAESVGAWAFLECSVYTRQNINEAVDAAVKTAVAAKLVKSSASSGSLLGKLKNKMKWKK